MMQYVRVAVLCVCLACWVAQGEGSPVSRSESRSALDALMALIESADSSSRLTDRRASATRHNGAPQAGMQTNDMQGRMLTTSKNNGEDMLVSMQMNYAVDWDKLCMDGNPSYCNACYMVIDISDQPYYDQVAMTGGLAYTQSNYMPYWQAMGLGKSFSIHIEEGETFLVMICRQFKTFDGTCNLYDDQNMSKAYKASSYPQYLSYFNYYFPDMIYCECKQCAVGSSTCTSAKQHCADYNIQWD